MSTASPISGKAAGRRAPVLQMSLAVIAVIAALAVIDVSLERTEQSELATQALQADRSGRQFLQKGKAAEAVDAFRKAHALERENMHYDLDLIQALMAAGKLSEAQPLMSGILDEESNDGEANLVAARLQAKQGHVNSAAAYYHRAIYGQWPGDVTQHQIRVRLELIDFLNAHAKQSETLAELLLLEGEAGNDPKLHARLAQLFLVAGSPSRSRDIYRGLIKANPKMAANYAGLGEAELALGDFRVAHAAFANAVARNENDPALRDHLALSAELNNLDPTLRWLSAQEKYSRVERVLQLASGDLEQCITNHPQLATDDTKHLLASAQAQLASPMPKQVTNGLAESTLSLAEAVWRARTSSCGMGTAPDEQPLRLIMEKLTK
jgi:tetratricopeptide (TPR) repeat protein